MRAKCIVEVIIDVPTLDDADDAIHGVWSAGDPEDMLKATVWTMDVTEVVSDERTS